MSADHKSSFHCEFSCGMRWNVQDVVVCVTLNITMTSAPWMLLIIKMAVVSTVALRYCYAEVGDRFSCILSLEDHSVNLRHHANIIWGFPGKMEICQWHWGSQGLTRMCWCFKYVCGILLF
jgi:hypothetical protein